MTLSNEQQERVINICCIGGDPDWVGACRKLEEETDAMAEARISGAEKRLRKAARIAKRDLEM